MRTSFARLSLASCLAALLLAGCGVRGRSPSEIDPQRGTVITAEEIRRSGAGTVWQALQRTVRHVQFAETGLGSPQRIRRRGTSSVELVEDIRIYVDLVRVADIRLLDEMPAAEVERIQVLTGIDATTYFGTDSTDGVILITTR